MCLAPAPLSADRGPSLKHFPRSLTRETKGGKEQRRAAATARRIILLVLHGLSAAQPLTPVRDDLTSGSVQEGRGPLSLLWDVNQENKL